MFKPHFQLTDKILTNLIASERLYGNLESKRVPQNLLLNLKQNNLIKATHTSNSIEGNSLTRVEVTNLLLNSRIPTNRDEKEIVNYFHILNQLEHIGKKKLDLSLILSIHSQLIDGINEKIKGQIRNIKVVVGKRSPNNKLIVKHNPPFHQKKQIEKALNELINWLRASSDQPILKAGIFHHQFVYIHPFVDGNGRTARLLTALIFLKFNYQINKYFILDDYYDIDRNRYSQSLHQADSGDETPWLEYFTNGVKYSFQSALGKIESGLSKLQIDLRPTKKEREVLKLVEKYRQLKTEDVVVELKISRQQAFNLLKSLVKKGFLKKRGITKNSFYELN